jgi:hypothetical protein
MKDSKPDSQDSIALDADTVSELEEVLQAYQRQKKELEELRDDIAEVREEMVYPVEVQEVLREYGLSAGKASEIVETVERVSRKRRGDTDK